MNNQEKISIISGGLAALMFIAILDLPYGYYDFLRVATFAGVLYLMYLLNQQISEPTFLMIFLGIIVFLWNPILPIYLDKGTWTIFNFIAGVLLGFIAFNVENLKN